MTPAMIVAMVGMAICYAIWVHFYGRATAARNSAIILARIAPLSQDDGSLYADSISPTRLAKSAALQRVLKNAPTVNEAAGLLDQSGKSTTVAEMYCMIVGVGLLAMLFAVRLGCAKPAAFFIGIVLSSTPVFYFMQQRAKRLEIFERQLPQVLEMLTLYLRSGRSLPQAFVATAEEVPAPASEELATCSEAYRLGRPLPAALKILSTKFPDALGLKLFAIAVSVLGQTGGNLVEVLERIKHTLEANLAYVLKLRSMTGETRTSGTILSALPGFFMALAGLANPEYFNQFFSTKPGMILFGIFCTLWGSGILWIRRMMASRA